MFGMDRKHLVARAQSYSSEFSSSSTLRPVTRNLITIRGLKLKVQYNCYEIFHNTQSDVANWFLHFICRLIGFVQVLDPAPRTARLSTVCAITAFTRSTGDTLLLWISYATHNSGFPSRCKWDMRCSVVLPTIGGKSLRIKQSKKTSVPKRR